MITIKDKVTYLKPTNDLEIAANAELKSAISYVSDKVQELNQFSGEQINFYGTVTTQKSDTIDLWWEVTNQDLDREIVSVLERYNNQ